MIHYVNAKRRQGRIYSAKDEAEYKRVLQGAKGVRFVVLRPEEVTRRQEEIKKAQELTANRKKEAEARRALRNKKAPVKATTGDADADKIVAEATKGGANAAPKEK